jgi:hypothetical protein
MMSGSYLKFEQSSSTFRKLRILLISFEGPPIIDVPESTMAVYIP